MKAKTVKVESSTQKIDFEVPRKIWHSCIGFIVLIIHCNNLATHWNVALTLTPATIIWGIIERLRLNNPEINKLVHVVLGPVLRKEEQGRITGTFYFLIGCIVCLVCFPDDIAVLALVFLSWCDPMASLIGVLYGKYTVRFANGKSLAGSLAAVATAAVTTWVLYSYIWNETLPEGMPLWLASLVCGLIAGVAEGVNIMGIDDNLILPVVASILLSVFFKSWAVIFA